MATAATTTVPASTGPPGTTTVTLNPPSATHGIPGDATDPADFYGIVLALAAMAVALVVVRVFFRSR